VELVLVSTNADRILKIGCRIGIRNGVAGFARSTVGMKKGGLFCQTVAEAREQNFTPRSHVTFWVVLPKRVTFGGVMEG
jgi:hypothetical protein